MNNIYWVTCTRLWSRTDNVQSHHNGAQSNYYSSPTKHSMSKWELNSIKMQYNTDGVVAVVVFYIYGGAAEKTTMTTRVQQRQYYTGNELICLPAPHHHHLHLNINNSKLFTHIWVVFCFIKFLPFRIVMGGKQLQTPAKIFRTLNVWYTFYISGVPTNIPSKWHLSKHKTNTRQ